ncbi:MAG: alpha-2-macroglobulin [Magnetococcales bacterium]|nr:alpha-2-macroglobulin [Magnetococcales bacterium]
MPKIDHALLRILRQLPLSLLAMAALLWLLATQGLQAAGQPENPPSVQIEHFSPQGVLTTQTRQVAVRFGKPMVAFGDSRQTVFPFTVECPVIGQGRWLDGRNWVYEFEHLLPPGLGCTFTPRPELRSLDNLPVKGEKFYRLVTGEPAILAHQPYQMITEDQVFVLGANTPLDRASLQAHLHCVIPGVGERVGVHLLEGEERQTILKLQGYFPNNYLARYLTGGLKALYADRLQAQATPMETLLDLATWDDSPLVVVQCQQRFPNATPVELVWEQGIRSAGGIESTRAQRLSFKVRDSFSAGFDCPRSHKQAHCMPILPMQLSFSAPIARADALKIQLKGKNGTLYPSTLQQGKTNDAEEREWVDQIIIPGPFPVEEAFTLEIPPLLKDDAGRTLINQDRFPMAIQTDPTPPLAKFAAPFGIIEAGGGALLPVTLRNLESLLPLDEEHPGSEAQEIEAARSANRLSALWQTIRDRYWPQPAEVRGRMLRVKTPLEFVTWMKRVQDARRTVTEEEKETANQTLPSPHRPGEHSVFENLSSDQEAQPEPFSVPKPGGGKAFEVVGIPLPGPGYYVVEVASDRLGAALHGEARPYYVPTTVLVTNLAAHLKRGQSSSLVWVTTLDEGKPVADAQVTITDCAGALIHAAKTDAEGIVRLPDAMPIGKNSPACDTETGSTWIVSVQSGADATFTLSSWDAGIQPYQFNLPLAEMTRADALFATVFDRTLLRAGETVSMKHLARTPSAQGFEPPGPLDRPGQLRIRHLGSDQVYATLPLEWDEGGVAVQRWPIPREAKSGNYAVEMFYPDAPDRFSPSSGQFRVDAFRVPTMKATLAQQPDDPAEPGRVGFDLQVQYLSGGAAGQLPVQVRGMLQPKRITFEDYEGFHFANGAVREGVVAPGDRDSSDGESEHGKKRLLPVQSLTLDHGGGGRVVFSGLEPPLTPQTLLAEMEFQDANGERVTAATQVTRLPSDILLGIKPDRWRQDAQLKFQVVALNPDGKPLAKVPVTVELLEHQTFSHRKRLIGGYYEYVHHNEIKRLAEFCSGITDAQGLIDCEGSSPVEGEVLLQARATDGKNQASFAHASVWIYKNEQTWFEVEHHNRMDLIPEKNTYEPGEEAVLQLRMPFREATVLITVEREGILDHFIRPVTGDNPTVRVPIRGHFAPNVFISAMAIRGRVSGVEPTALIDLGKPAFRLGYARLKVGWKAHELAVKVTTDQAVCKVRDTVTATIQVAPPTGRALPGDAEVAVAVVDEGLLELKPNDSWNLLAAMMQKRSIQVETSTALEQVIGRRHFGRKSFSPGGSGGRLKMERQLLDTLLLWQGRVKLDAQGRAQVTIPVNDQLTSFRVVAVAHAGADLFGTGETAFRTAQDLILHSALPPVVREQDRFLAGFTVRNSSNRPLTVQVQATLLAQASPGLSSSADLPTLAPLSMTLEPGASHVARWEITVPVGLRQLSWEVAATADGAEDRLAVSQEVTPVHPVGVVQATLQQTGEKLEFPVRPPVDALPNRGGIRLVVQDRLTWDLAGVREYMAAYPYSCLEQRLSKAIATQDAESWERLSAALPTYLDGDGLAKFFPRLDQGSDSLTSYLLAISHENGWSIPDEPRKKMIEGLQKFVQGKIARRSPLPAADLNLRKLAALEAISRYQTVANEAISPLTIEPRHWPTSGVIDWLNLLNRTPKLPDRGKRIQDALQNLRNRVQWQGTTVALANEQHDAMWWLLVSGETNLHRLLLGVLNESSWKEDLPRLVRGMLARQVKGHWASTPANAWGVVALKQAARKLDAVAVTGVSKAELAGSAQTLEWSSAPHGDILDFPWPATPEPQKLLFDHQGTGKPWVTVQSRAAIPLKQPMTNGYRLSRTVTPVARKTEGVWSQGDVIRVRLEFEADSDMGWVVVIDPIPTGSAILGSGLGRDSAILDQTGKGSEAKTRRPSFEERRFDAFVAYYEWLPRGQWSVEYTVRLNNPGQFILPASRVEAMYLPDLFGAVPVEPITVQP